MSIDSNFDAAFLYNQLDTYPWSEDEEFQGGLRAILGSVQDPSQVEHLTLRAKCYYFARKSGTPVDFDGYKRWTENAQDLPDAVLNGRHDVYDPLVGGESHLQAQSGVEGSGGEGGMGGMGAAPKPASFAEICELIQEGKPIPGIKDIPDTILEGQASDSSVDGRKKPWEKDGAASVQAVEQPSWMQ